MENLHNTATELLPESKIDATHRLQREGRWDEATVYRGEVREQLRAEGKTKAEANEGAWPAMIEKFPPLPPNEIPTDGLDDLLERCGDHEVDLVEDILWVYQHLVDKAVRLEDVPGPGAWALLEWSRQYRNKFFETLLPKALALKEKRGQDPESEMAHREHLALEELAERLRGFWEECKQSSLNEFGLPD